MSETEPLITSQPLAEVMAYTEQPYYEMIVQDPNRPDVNQLIDMAQHAGALAAQAYLADQTAMLERYVRHYGIELKPSSVLDEQFDKAYLSYCADSKQPVNNRVLNMLYRENIKTVRDVLMFGKTGVSAVRNIGKETVNDVARAVTAIAPKHPFLKKPSVEDIADLADDLGQVPFLAVNSQLIPYFERRTLVGLSVQSILTMSQTAIADRIGRHTSGTESIKTAKRIRQEAETFQSIFETRH